MSQPAAFLHPAPLLLPGDCLLPVALRSLTYALRLLLLLLRPLLGLLRPLLLPALFRLLALLLLLRMRLLSPLLLWLLGTPVRAIVAPPYSLGSSVTLSTTFLAGTSFESTTIAGARSVGLSVVPKSAALSEAEEMSRPPVSFRAFFARAHHSGLSQ